MEKKWAKNRSSGEGCDSIFADEVYSKEEAFTNYGLLVMDYGLWMKDDYSNANYKKF